jgi:hypothetical protein
MCELQGHLAHAKQYTEEYDVQDKEMCHEEAMSHFKEIEQKAFLTEPTLRRSLASSSRGPAEMPSSRWT